VTKGLTVLNTWAVSVLVWAASGWTWYWVGCFEARHIPYPEAWMHVAGIVDFCAIWMLADAHRRA